MGTEPEPTLPRPITGDLLFVQPHGSPSSLLLVDRGPAAWQPQIPQIRDLLAQIPVSARNFHQDPQTGGEARHLNHSYRAGCRKRIAFSSITLALQYHNAPMRLFNQKQKSRVCCRPAARPAVQKGWTCPADSPYQVLWITVPERTCSEHQVSPEYPGVLHLDLPTRALPLFIGCWDRTGP